MPWKIAGKYCSVPGRGVKGLTFLAVLVALSLLLSGCASTEATSLHVSVKELLTNPWSFDGKLVTITGRIINGQLRIAQTGLPTYTFDLDDGTNLIPVVASVPPSCPPGGSVDVEGWFRGQRQVGPGIASSRLEAISVSCR